MRVDSEFVSSHKRAIIFSSELSGSDEAKRNAQCSTLADLAAAVTLNHKQHSSTNFSSGKAKHSQTAKNK